MEYDGTTIQSQQSPHHWNANSSKAKHSFRSSEPEQRPEVSSPGKTTATAQHTLAKSRMTSPQRHNNNRTNSFDSSSYTNNTVFTSTKVPPSRTASHPTSLEEAKRREKEKGPSVASAMSHRHAQKSKTLRLVPQVVVDDTIPVELPTEDTVSSTTQSAASHHRMMEEKRRTRDDAWKYTARSTSIPRARSTSIQRDDDMKHQARMERSHHRVATTTSLSSNLGSSERDQHDQKKQQQRIHSRSKMDRSSSGSVVESRTSNNDHHPSMTTDTSPDEQLAAMKRRERERGPTLSSPAVGRSTTTTRIVHHSTTLSHRHEDDHHGPQPRWMKTSATTADDDMAAAKRREQERGPTLFPATSSQRSQLGQKTNSNKWNSQSSVRNPVIVVPQPDSSGIMSNDDSLAAAKRRERESGPTLAPATMLSAFRRTSSRTQGGGNDVPRLSDSIDPMMAEMKRPPSEATSSAQAKASAASRHSHSSLFIRPSHKDTPPVMSSKRSSERRHQVGIDVDDDDMSTDSAYALAMARSNLHRTVLKETEKLREHESGPSLATATGPVEIHPGALTFIGRELNAKDDSRAYNSHTVVPRSPLRMTTTSSARLDAMTDIEAQAGVPVVLPGAFAVHGVSAQHSDSDYTSADESDYYSGHDSGIGNNMEANHMTTDIALEAEVYEHVVVDGAVVTAAEDEEEILDPKTMKRLRVVQLSILGFALCAIGIIIGTIIGLTSKGTKNEPPQVEGWTQVGPDIYGPTDEPQTLFGSTLAMSGDGLRIAVAAPGTDNETSLNVGEVYILEAYQNENGTDWQILDVVAGPGPSNEAHISLAMSQDSTLLAVGYSRLSGGSQIQVYQEKEGLWQPQSLPIFDVNTSDTAWFGYAVDLSNDGSLLAVGAPLKNGPYGTSSGVVQVYQNNGVDSWIQLGSDIYGITTDEFFGWSVSLGGSTGSRIAIGAPVSNDNTGVVRVFDWDGISWMQVGTDMVGDIPLSRFGESVALSDDGLILAVGARGSAFDEGSAKLFRENNGQWEVDNAIFRGKESGEGFGAAVALSGDGGILAIGGPQSNYFGENAGIVSVYQYDESGQSWTQIGSLIGSATVAEFGVSIAISNDGLRVAAGAPTTAFDGSISRAGSVLVFDPVAMP
jgi:hypothetical protein